MFAAIGIRLIDFKLEFGRIWDGDYARVILADEISPDGCRLWDMKIEREARQGPLPPGPRRGRAKPTGSRPPARPAAEPEDEEIRGPRSRQPPEEARQVGRVTLPRARVVTLNAALGPLDYRVPDGHDGRAGLDRRRAAGPAPIARRRVGGGAAADRGGRRQSPAPARRAGRRAADRRAAAPPLPNGPRIIISRRWPPCCGWSCRRRPRSTARAS